MALRLTHTELEDAAELVAEIEHLKQQRNAVILAHNYQYGEIQDIADFVGDSLGLSQAAARTDADVIVFCGVHFMAETAAILCPDKTVLLPDLKAGCSLADTITGEQLRAWKAEHPGAVVVSYVNTTAEVKAESDYCCTSGNALRVIEAIPAEHEILFLPDMFLGSYLRQITGRPLHIWLVSVTCMPVSSPRWLRPCIRPIPMPILWCILNAVALARICISWPAGASATKTRISSRPRA